MSSVSTVIPVQITGFCLYSHGLEQAKSGQFLINDGNACRRPTGLDTELLSSSMKRKHKYIGQYVQNM